MLKFTHLQDGTQVWINPQQVSALSNLKQEAGEGCAVLLTGGFEIQVRESAAEVAAQVQKRLDAY